MTLGLLRFDIRDIAQVGSPSVFPCTAFIVRHPGGADQTHLTANFYIPTYPRRTNNHGVVREIISTVDPNSLTDFLKSIDRRVGVPPVLYESGDHPNLVGSIPCDIAAPYTPKVINIRRPGHATDCSPAGATHYCGHPCFGDPWFWRNQDAISAPHLWLIAPYHPTHQSLFIDIDTFRERRIFDRHDAQASYCGITPRQMIRQGREIKENELILLDQQEQIDAGLNRLLASATDALNSMCAPEGVVEFRRDKPPYDGTARVRHWLYWWSDDGRLDHGESSSDSGSALPPS